MRILRRFGVFVAMMLMTATGASAPATAELNGRVTDESGAVLPGVTVTATQTDTGFTRTVVTDESGSSDDPDADRPVPARGRAAGIEDLRADGIVLQVGAEPTINASLGVGNLRRPSRSKPRHRCHVRSAGISAVVDQARSSSCRCRAGRSPDLIMLAGAAIETGRPGTATFRGA